jgi:hypothetical protein
MSLDELEENFQTSGSSSSLLRVSSPSPLVNLTGAARSGFWAFRNPTGVFVFEWAMIPMNGGESVNGESYPFDSGSLTSAMVAWTTGRGSAFLLTGRSGGVHA